MKASSRQTSRNKKVVHVLLVGIILFTILFFVPRVIGLASSVIFTPIIQFESWIRDSSSTLPSYLRDRSALLQEIEGLRKKVIIEQNALNTIARLQDENRELSTLLGGSEDARIAAGVIGRPNSTPYDVLVLDRGTKDGVVQFAPVYIGIDTAIGYVANVFPDSSIVVLATTPDFESTVYIIGPNIYTTARGVGGGVLEVSVPQGIVLTEGDLVVVPALGGGVYGSIEVVNSVPSEPEQRGYVTLKTPMQSIRFVGIGTTPLNPRTFEEAVDIVEEVKSSLVKVPVPSGVLVDVETATGTATSTIIENEDQPE